MKKEELMGQAQKALTRYASKGMDNPAKHEITEMVQRFFAERVSCLGKSEIMEHMATPMKALRWFNAYLCEKCWRHCCTDTEAENANTCALG
jgi:hypothetical protein